MATSLHPVPDASFLRGRLAALRRRLYVVSSLRGVSWLVSIVLFSAAIDGVLDWRFHLPGFVRAVILVATLAGAAYVALRLLFRPLAERTDDLSLALRVEESFPSLNDALASTVQFLNEPANVQGGDSPSLRQEAIRRAADKINTCDFNRIVDTRGLPVAGLSMVLSGVVAVLLVFLFPSLAVTAMARLANPFGAHEWPAQTCLQALTAGPLDAPVTLIAEEAGSASSPASDSWSLRVGRGQPFLVRGKLTRGNKENGLIPKRAVVFVRGESGITSEHSCEIVSDDKNSGRFETKLDTSHFPQGFSFHVVANDAVSQEYKVAVLQPPLLIQLDGKPSPQVTLEYPNYTGLQSPQTLPAGLGDVEAIAGTVVTLRARADRRLLRAWIEYQPDLKYANLSAFLSPLGAASVPGVLALNAAGVMAFSTVEAQLDADSSRLTIRFLPYVSGLYVLHIEDETHLRNNRSFALRLRLDPAPTVQLDRPSPSRDVLTVLPEAVLPVQVVADDSIFAVRSVFISYRTHRNDPPRYIMLYDHALAARQFVAPATGAAIVGVPEMRYRQTHLECQRSLALPLLRHLDGSALQEGDVVTLQACADDFDDVSVNKPPGVSAEVEIRIIGRNALELLLNQEQTRIQQDLLRQREKEREAEQDVIDAENRLKKGEKLNAEDRTKLLQAEQLQQQIRERIGDDKEGLRAEVQRILRTVEQNGLQNSAVRDRMKDVDRELQRLGEKELEQIEPRLADVRTLAELMEDQSGDAYRARMEKLAKQTQDKANAARKDAGDKRAAADKAEELANKRPQDDGEKKKLLAEAQTSRQQADQLEQKAHELERQAARERQAMDIPDLTSPQKQLADARREQAEVERTLNDLLTRLEPWSSSREIKGEASKILEEQRKVLAELEEMKKDEKKFLGKLPNELTDVQRTELDNLRDAQQRLEERMNQLQEKMKRVAEERADKDPETAKRIEEALKQATEGNISSKMRQAREEIQQNKLTEAQKSQQKSIQEMQKMVKSMEDRRADDLERLIKKMKEMERELTQLAEEQEQLQKKVQEANKIADPAEREDALRKLTAQQKKLQEKTEDVAKQLTRLRNDGASQALARAGGEMEQASDQLRKGNNAEQKQEDVLDRIDDAQRAVEKARKRAEEELTREQLTAFADVLKQLREKQAAFNAEAERIQREVMKKEAWSRGLTASLKDLGGNQQDLSDDTANSSGKELAGTPVFAKQVQRSAEAMKQAGERFKEMYKRIVDSDPPAPETLPDAEATRAQKEALRRIDQLLDAIKTETDALAKKASSDNGPPGGTGEPGGPGGSDEGLPPVGQLKLLLALQTEVNQAIATFQKTHPALDKLDEKEKAEYKRIQRDQQEIMKLVELLRDANAEASEKQGDNK